MSDRKLTLDKMKIGHDFFCFNSSSYTSLSPEVIFNPFLKPETLNSLHMESLLAELGLRQIISFYKMSDFENDRNVQEVK